MEMLLFPRILFTPLSCTILGSMAQCGGKCLRCGCGSGSGGGGDQSLPSSCVVCVFCNVDICFTCGKKYTLQQKKLDCTGTPTEPVFSCGTASCEEAKRTSGGEQLQLKCVNTPIPPLNRTLLHTTILSGDCELTWKLLQCGANPYLSDSLNMNCIDLATNLCQNKMSKLQKNYQQLVSMLPKENDSKSHLIFPIPDLKRAGTAPSVVSTSWGKEGNSDEDLYDPSKKEIPFIPTLARTRTTFLTESLSLRQRHMEEQGHYYHRPYLKQQPHLASGSELFTPLSLMRVTSDSDADASLLTQQSTPYAKVIDQGVFVKRDLSDDLDTLISLLDETAGGAVTSFTDTFGEDDGGKATFEQLVKDSEHCDTLENEATDLKQAASLLECVSCFESEVVYSCSNSKCNGALCERCLYFTVFHRVRDALYAVPPIRCPGLLRTSNCPDANDDNDDSVAGTLCRARIPTLVWTKALRRTLIDPTHAEFFTEGVYADSNNTVNNTENTAELVKTKSAKPMYGGASLFQKYQRNAAAILTIRCGSCDKTYSLLTPPLAVGPTNCSLHEKVKVILHEGFPVDQHVRIMQSLLAYSASHMTAKELLVCSLEYMIEKTENKEEGFLPVGVSAVIDSLASLIFDVERRVTFQLAVLQMYPHIIVPCCKVPFCFMCKIMSHHSGLSCMMYQKYEMGMTCQYCPGCGVATLRSEGCSEIICVCGHSWRWDKVDESHDHNNTGIFSELVDQLSSMNVEERGQAFQAVSALSQVNSQHITALLEALKPLHLLDVVKMMLTSTEDECSRMHVALECLSSYCSVLAERNNWCWTHPEDEGDPVLSALESPQAVLLNLLLEIVERKPLDRKIIYQCMTVFSHNCHLSSFRHWSRWRTKSGDYSQAVLSQDTVDMVIIYARGRHVILQLLSEEVDFYMMVCKMLPHFVDSGFYIVNRLLNTELLIADPDLVHLKDSEVNGIKDIKVALMHIVFTCVEVTHDDKLCVEAAKTLLTCLTNRTDDDDVDVMSLLALWKILQGYDAECASEFITEVKVSILEQIPQTEEEYSSHILPCVPWLIRLIDPHATQVTAPTIQMTCDILRRTILTCHDWVADSRLDVLIQDLFAQKTEIGKEESYYGSAVELFVAITLSEGFNLITDQRIGSLVSCFLQMIRSESSEDYIGPCKKVVLLLNQLVVNGRGFDVGNMFLISANDMNMSMNSIITLLDWDSFEMHHNDNLNLEVLSFLSNLAAYSVNMRDNLLGTGIITKIEEYIFDGDCKKKVTLLTPHKMEVVARLLFHLLRGGRFRRCYHKNDLNRIMSMLHNFNKYRYSNACVVYQILAIEALRSIFQPFFESNMKSYEHCCDENLILSTKPKNIATYFTFTWQDMQCAIDGLDAISVLLACAETEMTTAKLTHYSAKALSLPFLNALLGGIVGGSPAQARQIWNHPGVMSVVLKYICPYTPRDTLSKILLAVQVVACMELVGVGSQFNSFVLLPCLEPFSVDCKSVEKLQRTLRAAIVDPLCRFFTLTCGRKIASTIFFERIIEAIECIFRPYNDRPPPMYHKLSRIENTIQSCRSGLEIIMGTFVTIITTSPPRRTSISVNANILLLINAVTTLGSIKCPRFTGGTDTHPRHSQHRKWQLMTSTQVPISSNSLFSLYHRLVPILSDGFLEALPQSVMDMKRDPNWTADTNYAQVCIKCFSTIWSIVWEHSEEAGQNFLAVCDTYRVTQKMIAYMLTNKSHSQLAPLRPMWTRLKIRHYTISKVIAVWYIAEVDTDNKLHGLVERYELSGMKLGVMTGRLWQYAHGAAQRRDYSDNNYVNRSHITTLKFQVK